MTKQERIDSLDRIDGIDGKKGSLFNKWIWENWTATCRRMKLDDFSYTIHTNKLKMDEGPECETGNHQNPRGESREKNLSDLSRSNFLLDTSPKARELKAKMNYWGLVKIKSFCTAKESINKTKRQRTEWEKIFASDISDKGRANIQKL